MLPVAAAPLCDPVLPVVQPVESTSRCSRIECALAELWLEDIADLMNSSSGEEYDIVAEIYEKRCAQAANA